MNVNICVVIRILIGLLFIVSGFEKLIGPYQNFLYVVQSYDILPSLMEEIVARVFPWAELLIGVFVTLGLWCALSLRAQLCLIAVFILVVGQAMIRGLPITECGCFGGLISFPLYVIFLFDSALLLLTGYLIKKMKKTGLFSLDQYFTTP